ncbi:hypothetical protein [Streptomyces sp. OK228]|uniref:hypothetical protein n=1 Tax=Streptomyces sp. OK228 TaxID=1882786 RepID=UPI000BDA6EB7|nr:hypothetical protein [Streptomyces sp. OK228]SOE25597.1 hypothetical protein SAMN05442782_2339 [Streptomyces sp. OK228]
MTQEPEPTGDRLTQLTEVARELLEEITELKAEGGEQFVSLAKRARSNRHMIWAVVVGCTLDVILTIAFGIGLFQVTNNADRIDALTQRLNVAQTDTRQRAWCPLYSLLLGSKSPQGRKAAADPKAYDHAFEVIGDGYRALNCDEFTGGTSPFTESPKG